MTNIEIVHVVTILWLLLLWGRNRAANAFCAVWISLLPMLCHFSALLFSW